MSILVTGSSGMIGTKLVESFIASHTDWIGVDIKKNTWRPELNNQIKTLDLLKPHGLDILPKSIDTIVHLAAHARVVSSIDNPNEMVQNVAMTHQVLEFARRRKISRIIFSSSKEVYGTIPRIRVKESHFDIGAAENPYAASKVACESLFAAYRKTFGIDSLILRFSNVYGPYDTSSRCIPIFIQRAMKGKDLTVFGAEKKLDFVASSDVVLGIQAALDGYEKAKNDVYNIAYGRGQSLLILAKTVARLVDKKIKISIAPNRPGEIMEYVADITKASRKLGYVPKTPLSAGVKETMQWFSSL